MTSKVMKKCCFESVTNCFVQNRVVFMVVLFVPSNAGKMITYFVMNKSRSLPFIIQRFDVCPQMYNDSYQ